MASRYPVEKKNQIVSRILSGEITVAEAHRTYGVATSCYLDQGRQRLGESKANQHGNPAAAGHHHRAVRAHGHDR